MILVRPFPLKMPKHMDFIGQRADKAIVESVEGIEEYEAADGVVREGVVKKVNYYTISCDECDGDGYYDHRGEVICEGCGMVLSGDKSATIREDWGPKRSRGGGRGIEKLPGEKAVGTHEPG